MHTFVTNPKCWVITEGLIGTENQCIGVANALGFPYELKRVGLKEPWRSLSPYLGFERAESFIPPLAPPWPDLLIASGRKSIAASRFIKKASNGHTFTVQIQDPRVSPRFFDLVAVPRHDRLRGNNVIVTHASPNKITPALLSEARDKFSFLGQYPSPRFAVLIGGSSKAYKMTSKNTCDLVQSLSQIQGSLMLTCSRRTGDVNQKILEENLKNDTNYMWNGLDVNPYIGLLSWADFLLVTADSASMISECCTTGKPVYMIPLDGGSKRITSLHNHLINYGALRVLDHKNGAFEPYQYTPLNDAQFVAEEIRKRMHLI
ncbi:MAG: mitochondrial fission ELM1 family protein [Alphaproteobacteria bacterium]